MYYPLQNMCSRFTVTIASRKEQSSYGVRAVNQFAPGTQNLGSIYAISASTGKVEWKYEQRAACSLSSQPAAGFSSECDVAGRFRAFDQRTGRILWQTNLGAQVTGFPVSYSVQGERSSRSTGQAVNTAAYLSLTPEIRPSTNSNLYIFALPAGWKARGPLRSGAVAVPLRRRPRRSLLHRQQRLPLAASPFPTMPEDR